MCNVNSIVALQLAKKHVLKLLYYIYHKQKYSFCIIFITDKNTAFSFFLCMHRKETWNSKIHFGQGKCWGNTIASFQLNLLSLNDKITSTAKSQAEITDFLTHQGKWLVIYFITELRTSMIKSKTCQSEYKKKKKKNHLFAAKYICTKPLKNLQIFVNCFTVLCFSSNKLCKTH